MRSIVSKATEQELLNAMKRSLGEVLDCILDPDITDIEYNTTSNKVFLDGVSGRQIADFGYDEMRAESFVHTVASYHGIEINEDNPTLSVILPAELNKCRLQANVHPVTRGVSIVLRKPGALYPIDDYVNEPVKELIKQALLNRNNILLAGATGSGKTSFLNSILALLNNLLPQERLNILEDTHEVQCSHANCEFLFTSKDRKGQEIISMADNVKNALRNNPDRIIAGEVRDQQSARAILNAWETGHEGGLCTFHASGARQGFDRYFHLSNFSWNNAGHHQFVASAIDYIFFLKKRENKRAVREVVSVDFDRQTGQEQFTQEYLEKQPDNH
jgi:type IV secretion system protein VirB11